MVRGTSVRDVWNELRTRFDVEEWQIPDEWRADRTDSPAGKILRELDRPAAPRTAPMFLLSGTIGTGKSTELWRIADERARAGAELVVFVDLVRHFQNAFGSTEALQHISSWEVCFLCGVALIRAAQDQGYRWSPDSVQGLADAWSALAGVALPPGAAPPSIDVFAAAKSMVLFASTAASALAPEAGAAVTVVKSLAELASAGKWSLPMAKKDTRRIEDQDPLMQSLVDRVNVLLGEFRQWSRPVLFVIDGLDRIVSFERAEALFLHSQMLARLQAPLVVCAPFALRNHLATSEVRRFKPRILHNVPVLDHADPTRPGPGVAFFRDLFQRRVHGLGAEHLVPQPLLERLAYYSGGRARDFVRTIRMLADYGYDDAAPVATEAMVEEVIKEARQLIEGGVDKGHVALLESVARDPKHELPDNQTARELLTYARLLPYPNESEWFYPHPLLMISKVRL
ncbi:hypothetical protein WME98_09660 [Sorangium sp. So ce296]|uniref:hypothetical protein n=1 Tax=Sorangium sp. So ce296 TaxID=3133296 RepID=UPI003F612F7A